MSFCCALWAGGDIALYDAGHDWDYCGISVPDCVLEVSNLKKDLLELMSYN